MSTAWRSWSRSLAVAGSGSLLPAVGCPAVPAVQKLQQCPIERRRAFELRDVAAMIQNHHFRSCDFSRQHLPCGQRDVERLHVPR